MRNCAQIIYVSFDLLEERKVFENKTTTELKVISIHSSYSDSQEYFSCHAIV